MRHLCQSEQGYGVTGVEGRVRGSSRGQPCLGFSWLQLRLLAVNTSVSRV